MTDPAVINARSLAYQHALGTAREAGKVVPSEVLDIAKKIETWFWGGFAPIERPPTPLSTIEEAAQATINRVGELAEGTADLALRADLVEAAGMFQRFVADVHGAIARAQERSGRPQAA
ncbi:MAG TPA: hypothetical protein VJQ82_08710 [Terriglobales bacterium]|nr:hypothetical protein [Terriglobales bacterium]